jgi:hypothetical protein
VQSEHEINPDSGSLIPDDKSKSGKSAGSGREEIRMRVGLSYDLKEAVVLKDAGDR